MKILTIATEYPPSALGGSGIYAGNITDGLRQIGHAVTVATTAPGRLPGDEIRVAPAGPSMTLTAKGWDAVDVLVPNVYLAALLGTLEPVYDIIHFHDVYSGLAAIALKAQHGWDQPVVMTKHTGPTSPTGTTAGESSPVAEYMLEHLTTLEAWLLSQVEGTIAVSDVVAETIATLYPNRVPGRVQAIAPGIDPAVFSPTGDASDWNWCHHAGGMKILAPGRLTWAKGCDVMLDAIGRLGDDYCVTFAGSGPNRDQLEQDARSNGIADRVHFLERVEHSQMPALYRGADTVAITSRQEAYGMVVAEAQACGAIVIASNVGGMAKQIAPGQTGFTFEVGQPTALATAIENARDHESLSDIRNNAALRSKSHTWVDAATATASFFDSLTKGQTGDDMR